MAVFAQEKGATMSDSDLRVAETSSPNEVSATATGYLIFTS
jgi:hypothetical protein